MAENSFRRVNWKTGMLLTREHFQRSDAYSIELFEWLLRYSASTSGLLGGGPRLPRSERGLERLDPKIDVWDDGATVRVSILQARGVTPDGGFVEVGAPRVLRREYRREELTGQTELIVYLVRSADDLEDEGSVGADEANPIQSAWVFDGYKIELGVRADELGDALAVGRIRRVSETQTFELDAQFIPACASMLGHSSLFSGWKALQDELRSLSGGFGELHRLIATYVEQLSRRGHDTRGDQNVSAFVERAVLSLDDCAYETMDSSLSPMKVFQQIDRAGRQIALALDLSAHTRDYLTKLSVAETTYAGLLEEERNALSVDREVVARSDLRLDLVRAQQSVARVRALLHALEGKYVDYRVNRSVDALRFMIDPDGERFYSVVATQGHLQRMGDLVTAAFAQLNLPGRHEYRLLILGDPHGVSRWEVGEEMRPNVQINASSGGGKPISQSLRCELPNQRNFALNFNTPPELATITSIHLSVQPAHKIRGAVLYQRNRALGFVTGAADPEPVVASSRERGERPPDTDSSTTATGSRPRIKGWPPKGQ